MDRIVVIGGGQAGASLVAKLRSDGFGGRIDLFCGEPVIPYQRPPLSKAYLKGEMELERLYLRPARFYEETDVTLHVGQTVSGIDRAGQTVTTNGDPVPYDALVLTTGATPRCLPKTAGGALGGVHVVRTLADIDGMSPEVGPGKSALVLGGGYIGLEAAAVLASKGMSVTLVEMAERILNRVAAPETSDYFRRLHQAQGVDILESTALERLLGGSHVTAGQLASGEMIPADLVVVGIGVTPETTLAETAGLTIDNGIAVDAFGRTSDPSIWAAGDCASFPRNGVRIRLESVQNAIDQAENVAMNILGSEVPYDPSIWFWSDQYDAKLQIAGLNTGYDRIVTRKQSEDDISFWYYRGDNLLAVDAINDPRAYMVAKRMIDMGKTPDPTLVANPETDLKALLKA